jgi:hypothetical protein
MFAGNIATLKMPKKIIGDTRIKSLQSNWRHPLKMPAESLDGISGKVVAKRYHCIFRKVSAKRFFGIFKKCRPKIVNSGISGSA